MTNQPNFIDQIICGDALHVMRQMPDECMDLVVTSPPYDSLRTYHGYTLDVPAMVVEFWRIMKPGGVIVWIVGDATVNGSETGTSFRQALTFMDAGFNLHDTMIWDKGSPRYPDERRYYNVYEYMFLFSKGRPSVFNPIKDRNNIVTGLVSPGGIRNPDGSTRVNKSKTIYFAEDLGVRFNIWKTAAAAGNITGHPAPFPEKLAADHIKSWSNEGDLVLDPMCGSGTTCKMALKLDRHWIGVDVSPEYCQIARERIRIENSQLKLDLKQKGGDE